MVDNASGLVSVIIPNYNCSIWIEKCVESCISQSFLKEIIIVDDHSTDDSVKRIKILNWKYPDKVKYFINPRKGANSARNYGFEQSSGQYIQWLDADDYLLPGKFKTQINTSNITNCDIVYSDWRIDYYENNLLIESKAKICRNFEDYLYQLLIDNWSCPNNYLLKRDIAKKLRRYEAWNPIRQIGQDREYFTLAGIYGAKFAYVSGEFAVYNKWSKSSISAMDFPKRLLLNQDLEKRFRCEIKENSTISKSKKNLYYKVLNTHKLKAIFYSENIKFDDIIFPSQIIWHLAHWKMRLVLPWILIRENIKLISINFVKK